MKTWGEIEKYLRDQSGPDFVVFLKKLPWEGEGVAVEPRIYTNPPGMGVRYCEADASPLTEESVDILRSWRVVSLRESPNGLASSRFEAVLRKPERPKAYALRFQGCLIASHDTEEGAKAAKYDAIHVDGYDERGLSIERGAP